MAVSLTIPERSIHDMNTTPLIDVMLVLLIMFIITLPAPSHAVKIDLPANCAQLPEGCPNDLRPDANTLYVADNGALVWNTTGISSAQLDWLLAETRKMEPQPELRIQPDPLAPQESVARVIRATKIAGITRMGFVGNENYTAF